MKKLICISTLVFVLVSCTTDTIETIVAAIEFEPTYLRIVNETEEDFYSINQVELDTYKFRDLNIRQGNSRKLRLDGVLPEYTEDLEIVVTYSSATKTLTETGIIDLYSGGTTTIWLTGREGCGGCGGHRIEWSWED